MKLSILLSSAAFFNAILATPHGRGVLASRDSNKEQFWDQNWAGAELATPPEGTTFKSITTTFTVPTAALPARGVASTRYSASIWTGIGLHSNNQQDVTLQGGVTIAIQNSTATYTAWYAWTPNNATELSATDFPIKAGDSIKIDVSYDSMTVGTVVLNNLTGGKNVTQQLGAPSIHDPATTMGQTAEWILQGHQVAGELVPLVDFGKVTFTDCAAGTADERSVGTTGAVLYNVQTTSGSLMTKCSSPSSSQVLVSFGV